MRKRAEVRGEDDIDPSTGNQYPTQLEEHRRRIRHVLEYIVGYCNIDRRVGKGYGRLIVQQELAIRNALPLRKRATFLNDMRERLHADDLCSAVGRGIANSPSTVPAPKIQNALASKSSDELAGLPKELKEFCDARELNLRLRKPRVKASPSTFRPGRMSASTAKRRSLPGGYERS